MEVLRPLNFRPNLTSCKRRAVPVSTPDAEGTASASSVASSCASSGSNSSSDVLVARLEGFAGFAVFDTACQKNVCSKSWLERRARKLKQRKLVTKATKEKEGFQFGVGAVQFSKEQAYIPVSLDGSSSSCCLFRKV